MVANDLLRSTSYRVTNGSTVTPIVRVEASSAVITRPAGDAGSVLPVTAKLVADFAPLMLLATTVKL